MAFRRKCKICGEYITTESDAVEYKSGYVHSKCFSISLKAIQENRQEKIKGKQSKATSKAGSVKIPKQGLTEEEYREKVEFFDYLKTVIGEDKLPAKMYVIADRLMNTYKEFTFSGMKNTLEYCEKFQRKLLGDDCLGLIPYYYNEAQNWSRDFEQYKLNIETTLKHLDSIAHDVVKIRLADPRKVKQIKIDEIGVNDNDRA